MDITQAVRERYREELAAIPRPEFEDRVIAESDRLRQEIATAIPTVEAQLLDRWRSEHDGASPDFMTDVALRNQARISVTEMTLAQLWEGYRDPEDVETPSEPDPASMTGMARWRTEWAIEADRENEALAAVLWPTASVRFLVYAEQLLQARQVDGLANPTSPDDALLPELTAVIEQELHHDDRVAPLDRN